MGNIKIELSKPIIVIGLGRSGSSIFHEMFSFHPQLAWLSSLCDRNPSDLGSNHNLMKFIDAPLIGSLLQKKYAPEECYQFWEYHCRGFRTPCRDLEDFDVSSKAKKSIHKALTQTLTSERSRLLLKVTGWPRIGYLKELFADAIFIHVKRDPRAVANSLLNVDWWWGWRGPQNWRWGMLDEKYQRLWEQHNKSFVALAGIECLIYQEALEKGKKLINTENFVEVDYEIFCEQPLDVFKNVVDICGLNWTPDFEKSVTGTQVRSSNFKWKQDLSVIQQRILESVLNTNVQDFIQKRGSIG